MVCTLMPNGASSCCIDSAIASSACFVETCAEARRCEQPAHRKVNTIFPGFPAATHLLMTPCVNTTGRKTLTS